MAEFLLLALLAGVVVAIGTGPLGTLVVWQRLAYFGDTLAHSALLGVAFGLLLAVNPWWTVLGGSLLLALLLGLLQRNPQLNADSLLGILSHGSLALGLVTLSLADNVRVDLGSYLFGDLLAVGREELALIFTITAIVLLLLWRYWDGLVALTVHAELAAVEGLPVTRLRLLQLLMMAALVAVAMKVVGVLLITALLIIPANIARPWSRSPEQMALLAALAGALSVVAGVGLSLWLDTPTGASVVVCAALGFALSLALRRIARSTRAQ